MIKLESIPPKTLDELASAHFIGLNPTKNDASENVELNENAILYKLQDAIQSHNGDEKSFFEFLMGQNGSSLKTILIGMPEQLQQIITEFEGRFENMVFKSKNTNNKLVWNELGEKVIKIFNYPKYRSSSLCTDHLSALGLEDAMPCPYCNLDHISLVKHRTDEDKIQALLDLDHFFPHYKYPFLGVSLFNLIPTCKNCNQVYKKEKPFTLQTHVHPYIIDLDALFDFKLDPPYIFMQSAKDVDITFRLKSEFPANSLVDLNIIERYQAHRRHVVAKLNSLYKRPIRNLQQVFGTSHEQERKELFQGMGIPFDKEDIRNHSLGKLYRDLCIAADQYY